MENLLKITKNSKMKNKKRFDGKIYQEDYLLVSINISA